MFFGMIGVTLFRLLFTPSFDVITHNLGTWARERLPTEIRKLRLPRLRKSA
jgi:hypothetical protein